MTQTAVLSALAVLSWYFAFNAPMDVIKDIGKLLVPESERTAFVNKASFIGQDMPQETLDLIMGARSCVALALLGWAAYRIVSRSLTAALFPVASALLVWKLPDQWLRNREKQRMTELQREFPTMVTLVRVYSQAGDLYQGLNIAREALSGELRRQMDILAAEMELFPLTRALDNLARRCDYPPLTNFVSVVMLGIETGADITEVLDNFATEAYGQHVNEIKRKIKSQPVILSIVPAILALGIFLLLAIPMYVDIVSRLQLF